MVDLYVYKLNNFYHRQRVVVRDVKALKLPLNLGPVTWTAGCSWREQFVGKVGTINYIDLDDETIVVMFDGNPNKLWFAPAWLIPEEDVVSEQPSNDLQEDLFW